MVENYTCQITQFSSAAVEHHNWQQTHVAQSGCFRIDTIDIIVVSISRKVCRVQSSLSASSHREVTRPRSGTWSASPSSQCVVIRPLPCTEDRVDDSTCMYLIVQRYLILSRYSNQLESLEAAKASNLSLHLISFDHLILPLVIFGFLWLPFLTFPYLSIQLFQLVKPTD